MGRGPASGADIAGLAPAIGHPPLLGPVPGRECRVRWRSAALRPLYLSISSALSPRPRRPRGSTCGRLMLACSDRR